MLTPTIPLNPYFRGQNDSPSIYRSATVSFPGFPCGRKRTPLEPLSIARGWHKMMRKRRDMKATEKKSRIVTAAVIERDGKVLCARRKAGLVAGGLWEFPGGKLEEGEAPERGLRRELEEELGVAARVGEFLCSVPFTGSLASFELVVFRAELLGGDFRLTDHDEIRWLRPEEMDESLFSKPDRPVVRLLARPDPAGNEPEGQVS
jgi:8-oxo-dGTP diphosphatase